MEKKIVVGSQVEIIESEHLGYHGVVLEIFPAGQYDVEEIYMVRYSSMPIRGMFKRHELKLIWEK